MLSAELLSRIRKEGFDALDRLVAQTPRSAMLRRCAAVREFDRSLFDAVLVQGMEPRPTFDDVTQWDEVEAIPRRPGEFRVRDRQQRFGLLQLTSDLVDVSRGVAAFLLRQGESKSPERLYQLAAAAPNDAKDLFRSLFDEADAAGNLPRCQDLLNAVSERALLLPQDFNDLIADRRAYLRARSFWSDDFYKSRMYLERSDVSDRFKAFLNGKTKWMADMHAKGGMGKTAAIRWLIARYCATSPQRIPVARIDFDFDDPFKITTKPELLLLTLAEQLDEQIVGAPFVDLRADLESLTTAAPATAGIIQIAGYTDDLIQRFADSLAHARSSPTLFVFDTVEVAILNRTEMQNVIDILDMIRSRDNPALRVLFSGRYSLHERVATFAAYDTVTEPIALTPFEPPEARQYLTERRGLTDNAIVEAVISRSDGVPFKLSLFADIIRTTPDITATEILETDKVDVVHLIKRIIERIDNKQLHWVLRYGAIPRRLTKEFVSEVLSRLLAQAMSGKVDFDDPGRGISKEAQTKVFLQDLLQTPNDAIDVDSLWQDLTRYASDNSWVSLDRSDPDALKLHSEVVNPMRRLLEPLAAYGLLHRMAMEYFDRQIEKKPANRLRYVREAIYHRFQAGSADAETFWRQAIRDAIDARQFDDAREIAAEITGDAYVDGVRPLRRNDGSPIVETPLLAEAFLTDAKLLLRQARATGNNEDWDGAVRSMGHAENFLGNAAAGNAAFATLRAAIALRNGNIAEATASLDAAVPRSDSERLAVNLGRAELAIAQDDLPGMNDAIPTALDHANSLGFFGSDPPSEVLLDRRSADVEAFLIERSVSLQCLRGDFAGALTRCGEWTNALNERADGTAMRKVILAWARVVIDAGEPAGVAETLQPTADDELFQADVEAKIAILLLLAEAKRAALKPHEARNDCLAAGKLLEGREWSPARSMLEARVYIERARTAATLYEIAEARRCFETALTILSRGGDPRVLLDCIEAAARVELYEFDDPNAAEKFIDQLSLRALTPRAGVRIETLRREVLASRGVERAVSEPQPETIESLSIDEAVSLLSAALRTRTMANPERDVLMNQLAERIECVNLPIARVALLAPLRQLERPLTGASATRLHAALPSPSTPMMLDRPADRGLMQLRLADALRVCGDDSAAEKALDDAERLLIAHCPLATLEIGAARLRLGRPKVRRPTKDLQHVRKAFADDRGVLAMASLIQAERVSQMTPPRSADSLLKDAQRLASRTPLESLIAPRIERVRSRFAKNVKEVPAPGPTPPTKMTLAIDIKRANIGVVVSTPFGIRNAVTPAEALGGFVRSDELISQQFVRAIATGDASRLVAEMADYLFEYTPADFSGSVSLYCDDNRWHAFPWELALARRAAANLFRVRARLRPPFPFVLRRVVLVRPELSHALSHERGLSSLDLEFRYRNTGFEVDIVRPDEIEMLADIAGDRDAPANVLIHLCVGLSESRSAGTVLFGDPKSGVTTGLLASLFSSVGLRAFVVLDPPLPPSPQERWRQVMLRNVAAAELFNGTELAAVLGMTVSPNSDYFRILDRRGRFDELLPRERTPTPENAVALFCDSPGLVFSRL